MGIPLEDLFQKEFYRAFYFLVDGNALISPEFIAKSGKGGGGIDFLLSDQRWGFEFIRSGSNIVEHMGRFQLGGAYHSLIMSGLMSQYLVLDFRLSMPQKSRPGLFIPFSILSCILSNVISRVSQQFISHCFFIQIQRR